MKKHWQTVIIVWLVIALAVILIFGKNIGCNGPSDKPATTTVGSVDSTKKQLPTVDSVSLLKKQLQEALKKKKSGVSGHITVDVVVKDQREQPTEKNNAAVQPTVSPVKSQVQAVIHDDGVKNPVGTNDERTKATLNRVCFRLGGFEDRWIPQLAVEANEQFDNLEDNRQNSWNFWLPAANTLESPSGLVGQLKDGRYFVSADLIDRYLQDSDNGIVESRASRNYWQFRKMEKVGNYYIDIR